MIQCPACEKFCRNLSLNWGLCTECDAERQWRSGRPAPPPEMCGCDESNAYRAFIEKVEEWMLAHVPGTDGLALAMEARRLLNIRPREDK